MAKIVSAPGTMQMLYILLAATGLRVGEALGLEIKHLCDDCTTISIEQSLWEGDIQAPKTANAVRVVDIPTSVAALLKKHIGERAEGLVFVNRRGKALLQTNILRRDFHPQLKELGLKKSGFHAFRRFRTTHLRKNSAPEIFITGALGHAKASVTDGYDKTYFDSAWRKDVTERMGTGFEIPSALINPTKAKASVHTSSQNPESVNLQRG